MTITCDAYLSCIISEKLALSVAYMTVDFMFEG